MIKQPSLKIALVGEMLSGGGAERVQARLSVFFEEQGIDVHHIIVQDSITYEFAGTLYNMGKLKNKSNSAFNRLSRFIALKKYLKEHQFDYIIDFRVKNRFIQEYIIANWIYKVPYIMSIRSFNTDYYFPKNRFLAKRIYKKAYALLTVSKALEEKIKREFKYDKVITIYNPLDIVEIQKLASHESPLGFEYILGIGRMQDNIKQFDHLISAFKNSTAKNKGVKLLLIGDGEHKTELKALVDEYGLNSDVVFKTYQENPYPYMKGARFMALTSKNEGFPNVLIESLACGTPLVAYNCESGPDEIISHEHNGLLVKNQDIDAMTIAIDRMLDDDELYNFCKSNAKSSIKKFEIDSIGNEWLNFLKTTR